MSKRFQKLVAAQQRAHVVEELLQCGGYYPEVTPKDAIVQDWTHAVAQAQEMVLEHARFLSSEDEAHHRRCLRKGLARLVAVCVAWDKNLKNC